MLTDFLQNNSPKILFYCNGAHHFSMFANLFILNPDYEFVIYAPNAVAEDFFNSPLAQLPHVRFTTDFANLLFKLHYFGLLITTDSQTAGAHLKGLHLSFLCHRLKIKVIELQHGMFQLGLHYSEQGRYGIKGDSLPVRGYSDLIMLYYPLKNVKSKVIGYPPNYQPVRGRGEYTLILSNLHWNTYTEIERGLFYDAVVRLAAANPDELFVWKMHHGEVINKVDNRISFRLPPNLKLTHKDNIFNLVTAGSLIAGAKRVVSTISTVLLDCEIHHKPVCVYDSPATACLSRKIRRKCMFSNYAQLQELYSSPQNQPGNLFSGCLLPYDNEAFRAVVAENYALSPLPSLDVLEQVYPDYFNRF